MEDVTVVITSCKRLDLLKRTVASFLKFNTAPISEYILVDDSADKEIHNEIRSLYPNFTLIQEPVNRGQTVCMDDAYSRVKTPYIFLMEDDWEFYRSGFIENSMTILEENTKIIIVWLFGLGYPGGSAGYPVEDQIYKVGNVEYKLLIETYIGYHGWGWGCRLERLADYKLTAPRAQFGRGKMAGGYNDAAEMSISQAYYNMGYRAAKFFDREPPIGYVKHIGGHIAGREEDEAYWNMAMGGIK